MIGGPWRILFADDDPTAGLLMKAALRGDEFILTVVDNGRDAQDRLQSSPFDMALLDVEMPGLDGLAVCAAIRQSLGDGFPVILVSGRTDAAFIAEGNRLGASRLAKPIDWTALAGRLRAILDTSPR